MSIDEIDKSIIQQLKSDGRVTNKKIAETLELSEGTIRNRIKHLVENEALKIKGLTNPESEPHKQYVYVMIKLSGNRNSIEVARKVAALEPIKSVSIIAGRYDLVAEVFIETHTLIDFLNSELSQIESVLTVESLMTLKNFNKWV
ncbi:MAG: Lrp/AsnC family transcriptional regulator [Sphaerochaetaceae bacterium]